jgi:hypothetical protein
MSLARFVFERRRAADWLAGTRHLHLFFGNEASDADSIVSSICMAYACQQSMPSALHLCAPWVQCRRDDFKIRAETDALLRQAGVNPDWLVYQDDFQLPDDPPASGISLALLDHNKLSPAVTRSLEWPASHVSAVWDHHADQGLYKVSRLPRARGPRRPGFAAESKALSAVSCPCRRPRSRAKLSLMTAPPLDWAPAARSWRSTCSGLHQSS